MNPAHAVYAAARRLRDRGLAMRVIRDETQREMDAAREWIESGYVTCATCGEVVGDRTHLEGHWCSRRRSA